MTRSYDDIEAVIRLLRGREKDLELAVQIGRELLIQNTTLEDRITDLQVSLQVSNEDRTQLNRELQRKNKLIAKLINDADESENDTSTFSMSVTLDFLQKRLLTLQKENKLLKFEASQFANETTDAVEEHKRQLEADSAAQLNKANCKFENLSLELEWQREENRRQHEQIAILTAQVSEVEMRLYQLIYDNDKHVSMLHITKENQHSLALELDDFKQRCKEVLTLLSEAKEQLQKQRRNAMSMERSSFVSDMDYIQPVSLQSELMENSLESSMDSGIALESQPSRIMSRGRSGSAIPRGGSFESIFETVRCANRNDNCGDSKSILMSETDSITLNSSSSGSRISGSGFRSIPHSTTGASYSISSYDSYSIGGKTLSCKNEDMQTEDWFSAQSFGVPGTPGAKDLDAALNRLTPAEVTPKRAMSSFTAVGTYNYDDQPPAQPIGICTPQYPISTGCLDMSTSPTMCLPDNLQIVKPIEGSQILHHWSQLATPTLNGLLVERPGVIVRGARRLEDLGFQMHALSYLDEDASERLPGKPGCCFTPATNGVGQPDLSLFSVLEMPCGMFSQQASCPATLNAGLTRKNSCSTLDFNLGLFSMMDEPCMKALFPSTLNTQTEPNLSPMATCCYCSQTLSSFLETFFGLFSSGAIMIMRKLFGLDVTKPNRNQQEQQNIMLSRLQRRTLESLKLVHKVESVGLENILSTQPTASGIVSRGSYAQLTRLRPL